MYASSVEGIVGANSALVSDIAQYAGPIQRNPRCVQFFRVFSAARQPKPAWPIVSCPRVCFHRMRQPRIGWLIALAPG